MTTNPAEHPQMHGYLVDTENGAEMARLLDQEQLFTQAMGGPLVEPMDPTSLFDVLDIGCGPGGWVHTVARRFPEMEVTGIDISPSMVAYARAYAQVLLLPNAHFEVMDALQPLAFADASFDLVNARTIVGFVSPPAWPKLLAECRRVLRPGGIIQVTEAETGLVNTPAVETLGSLANQIMHRAGRGFSPTGHAVGITMMLSRLLSEAGFESVHLRAHAIDYSFGSPAHAGMYQNLRLMYLQAKSLYLKMHLLTEEAFETLYEQAEAEMQSDTFSGLLTLLTAWASKNSSQVSETVSET